MNTFETLLKIKHGIPFTLLDEEAFWFLQYAYTVLSPGGQVSGYGLGMLIGGSQGGYIADAKRISVEYVPGRLVLLRVRAGQYKGRIIGKQGSNIKAIQGALSKLHPLRVETV